MKPLVLDLFSGTGSATEPFVECGKHIVVRIDIAGRPDVRADVRHLPVRGPVDFIWGSPPCTKFSTAAGRHRDPEAGMVLVRAFMNQVAKLRPRYWAMENVRGARKAVSAEFGNPTFACRSWVVWGNLPLGLVEKPLGYKGPKLPHAQPTHMRSENRIIWKRRSDGWGSRESWRVAMIPRPLAEAVHRAVCDGPLAIPREGG